ncbi:MAG TPA: hypothetical protein VEF33_15725 [Syntrophales bacterium]|nr:hypothetical protein [Syntrophales bacterium]
MTKNIMGVDLPDNAELFKFSRGFRNLSIFYAVVCVVFLCLGLVGILRYFSHNWEHPNPLEAAIPFVLSFLIFGAGLIYSMIVLKKSGDIIATNDKGI